MPISSDPEYWLKLLKNARSEKFSRQTAPTDWKQVSSNTQNIMYIVLGLFAGASALSIANDRRR